jgi:hypothetical protein
MLPDGAAKALLSSLFFVGVVALMFVPCLLYRRSDSSSDPSESDGGGGPGPSRPRSSPDPPRAGIPLPDADPACARARDHNTPRFEHPNRRRPEHEPARTPAKNEGVEPGRPGEQDHPADPSAGARGDRAPLVLRDTPPRSVTRDAGESVGSCIGQPKTAALPANPRRTACGPTRNARALATDRAVQRGVRSRQRLLADGPVTHFA